MSLPRVLILTPDFPPAPGGIQLVIGRLAERLKDVELRIVALAFETSSPRAPAGAELVIAGRRGPSRNKLANARLNARGFASGLGFRPDVVITGHTVAAPAALALATTTGARTMQYLHADEIRERPSVLRFGLRRADAVVAVSEHARELALCAGADHGRVRVIPPGVDRPPERQAARADRPTILTVARMQEAYKGHDVMLRALPAIRSSVPDVRWIVVGDGRLRQSLERQAAELGVAEAVQFVGHVGDDERDRWFERAHVFSMPSRLPSEGVGGEGFGVVYLEAGARELPVVAGAVAGALDAVVDGETGLLVDPTDPTALASALVGLLTDPDRAARLGAAGAARAREFTWERHASSVGSLVRELVRK